MTKIFLIRHAEAEGNLYRRIHGQYDSLVTVRGDKQIACLERRFDGIAVARVYSSDLYRAQATAGAILKKRGLTLTMTPALREVAMGAWEDRTWGEVERFEPEQLMYFNNDPSQWQVEGCEDFHSLQRRVTHAILDIAARHDGETVAVVSHGSAIRSFMCGVYGVPPTNIQQVKHYDNTAVTLLHIGGGKIDVEYAGDNSHLPEELSTFAHQKWWRENATFDSTNLRFAPFDLEKDTETYLKYRRDAWTMLYGKTPAEAEEHQWLEDARKNAGLNPCAVSLALIYDTPVGAVELNTGNDTDENAGVVEFFYMIPEQRRTGIAVQLLGQAVSVYRSLGREKVRMSVSEKNEQTLGFCGKYGLKRTGETVLHGDKHVVLELDIRVR
jgi:probable phosphoglycerate mutase